MRKAEFQENKRKRRSLKKKKAARHRARGGASKKESVDSGEKGAWFKGEGGKRNGSVTEGGVASGEGGEKGEWLVEEDDDEEEGEELDFSAERRLFEVRLMTSEITLHC